MGRIRPRSAPRRMARGATFRARTRPAGCRGCRSAFGGPGAPAAAWGAPLGYKSGTKGPPKGVMLAQHNICSNVRAGVYTFRVSEDDTCLALLPLSHILERMVDYYFLHVGVTIVYAESIDAFAQNLQE